MSAEPSPVLTGAATAAVRGRCSGALGRARRAVARRRDRAAGRAGDPWLPRADVRLLPVALLAWGVGATLLGSPAPARVVTGLVAGLAGAALLRRPTAAAALLVVATVLLASGAHGLVRDASGLAALAAEGTVVRVEGTVAREPVRVLGGRGGPTWLLSLDVERVLARGRQRDVTAPVLVRGGEPWGRLTWGQRVAVSGRLTPMEASADREAAALTPLGPPLLLDGGGPLLRFAEGARAGLRRAAEPLSPDARGLLPALVVGDTSRTPTALVEDMKATGMTHLAAVSGTNTTIVLALVLLLARWLRVPRRWRPVVGVVALAGFVVLARPEPSVLRAAVMGAIGLVGVSRARPGSGTALLGGAVVVLLVVDPWLARSYGFVLSVLATLGLLVLAGPWGRALDRRLPRAVRGLGPVLAVPAAASLACAPVIVLLQGQVSLTGVVANALAAPLVLPATVAGILAAVLAPLGSGVVWVPVRAGGLACEGLARIAHGFAALSWGAVPWPATGAGALGLAVLCGLGVLAGRRVLAGAVRRPVAAAAVLALAGAGLTPARVVLWPPPDWRLVMCDVGQGDALVLRSGPGRAVLVDAGPEPALVDGCLARLGVGSLDAVVLTHFHADHVDGLAGALDGRPVARILVTPVAEPPEGARSVARLAAGAGVPVEAVWHGDVLRLGDVGAEVLWPARRVLAGSVPNNASLVLDAQVEGVHLLLLGDVEREASGAVRAELAGRGGEAFDAVKVAHHGSANLDERLWDQVRTGAALVSVGAGNDYGHPAPSTIALLRRHGLSVWRTDERGDVAVVLRQGVVGVVARGR